MRKFSIGILAAFLAIVLFIPPAFSASLGALTAVDEKVVENTAKALPQTTQGHIFKIEGGPIEVLSLTGEVTTEIGATSTKFTLRANPTTGSDTDLTTGATPGSDAVGTIYSLITSVATDMAEYTNGAGPGLGGNYPLIVPAGYIDLETAASVTGNITWRLRYRPLALGVTVTAE